MKRLLAPVGLLLLAVWGVAAAQAGRYERLAALGKLWAEIKYFHPALAYRDLDWDQALLKVLPLAASARTDEQYAASVAAMLAFLGDPATRVIPHASIQPPAPVGPLLRTEPDGVLLIALNPEVQAALAGDCLEQLRRSALRITTSRAVVFDLRRQQAWTDRDPSAVARWFIASGLNQRLAGSGLKVPAQRSRIHSGLVSAGNGGSAYFHSSFYVRDGAVFEGVMPAPAAIVFLVDLSSSLPPIAAALQRDGRAAIVAEEGVSDSALVECHRIELPGGVRVQFRVSELLYDDGTTGLVPDLSLPPREAGQTGDPALFAALGIANRGVPSSRSVRPPAPSYAIPRREQAYDQSALPGWEHRLLAGFRTWAAFRYFFAYRELMETDWDEVLLQSLPRLEAASSPAEYVRALAEMVARTGDSHVTLDGGPAVQDVFGEAQPPVRTRLIERVPVITALLDGAESSRSPLAAGDTVLKVDGEEAQQRLARLGRFIAASTRQSLEHTVMQYWLAGPAGSSVKLLVRDRAGRDHEVSLTRRVLPPSSWRGGDVMKLLPGNVGYADLDRLTPQDVEEMFERFKNTQAIIFDMRGYPRGTGWLIAPRLTEKKNVIAARFRRPLALAPSGLAGDVETVGAAWEFVQYLPASDNWVYKGRTVMLIDERAMSQAEHLGLFLEAANGTVFIGSPTAGANGDVARFVVPGGITISFSGHDVRHADGRQLQRVGLIPRVEVRPTIAGIRAGRDEVLERALRWLGVRNVRVSGVGEAR